MSSSRKRARASKLREQGFSIREIAAEVGAGRSTVGEWLKSPAATARPLPAPPRENARALKAGDTSERRRAPLRQKHSDDLRTQYPSDVLDDRLLFLLADAFAEIDLQVRWLDEQDGVVRNEHGDVFPVADRLAKARATAWKLLRELQQEARERRAGPLDLESYLSEHYGNDPLPANVSEAEEATDAE